MSFSLATNTCGLDALKANELQSCRLALVLKGGMKLSGWLVVLVRGRVDMGQSDSRSVFV